MKRVIAYCSFIVVLLTISCSYENTTTVTIDTGIRQQAQLSLFDRVLAFFSLSQPLQADPVPAYVNFEEMMVNVTAPDIDTISLHFSYTEIVNNNGRITLEVPAGSQRTFEVVAGNGGESRVYGGITTVDLVPGQQVNLNIEMGQLAYTSPTFNYMSNNVEIIYYKNNNISAPIFFKVYHNIGVAQPIYELIDTVAVSSLGYDEDNYSITYHYSNSEINSDNRMLYYISALNKYGEVEKVQIY